MKNLLKVFLILQLGFLSNLLANVPNEEGPTFRGTIRFQDNTSSINDSIMVLYKKAQLPSTKWEVKYLTTNSQAKFHFNLPKYKDPLIIRVYVKRNGKYLPPNYPFFSESDDDINIEIIKMGTWDSLSFSGYGSAKYQLINELNKLEELFRVEYRALQINIPINIQQKLISYANLTRKFEAKKHELIKTTHIGNNMQKMLTYEKGQIFFDWVFMLYVNYGKYLKTHPLACSAIRDSFNKHKVEFSYKTDSLMKFCPEYLFKIALWESRNIFINESSKQIKVIQLFNALASKYEGPIQEALIANLFLSKAGCIKEMDVNTTIMDSLMREGQKYITISDLIMKYQKSLRLNQGTKLFDATFTDINSKPINTSSLKGKVVLLDIWSTGCSACAIFHSEFKKNVYPLLKDKKDFVYLSISIDKTKEKWKKAISTEKYSSLAYLNVYTNGLGLLDHPFGKFYSIKAIPFLLIIDKNGNIFSNNFGNPETALKLINEALSSI